MRCLISFPGRLLKGHLGAMLVGFTAAAGACSPVGARRWCAPPPGACVGFLSRSREQRVTPTDGSESTGGVAANAALSFFPLLFVAVGFHIHCWRRDFRIQVIKRGRESRRLVVRISLCFFCFCFFRIVRGNYRLFPLQCRAELLPGSVGTLGQILSTCCRDGNL